VCRARYEIGSAQLTLGGCVANTGLALAAAGIPTRVCSRLGDDPLGEIARRLLTEKGVDLEGITTTAVAATWYDIVLQLLGHDRAFWHHAGANAAFTRREVNLDGVDILHLGYPPLLPALLADDAAPLLNLLKEARSRQITTALDLAVVNPRSSAAEVDWGRKTFAKIMLYVNIATPSIDDLTSALATRTPDNDLVEECAHRLIADRCAVAIVSAGARGASR
jgi:sugar/nucleoside kinase (ribokinase family)